MTLYLYVYSGDYNSNDKLIITKLKFLQNKKIQDRGKDKSKKQVTTRQDKKNKRRKDQKKYLIVSRTSKQGKGKILLLLL